MVANSRKSNFNIGEEARIQRDVYAVDTSNKAAYKGWVDLKSKSTDTGVMDFKRANFKFGNSSTRYITTNNDEYENDKIYECISKGANMQSS